MYMNQIRLAFVVLLCYCLGYEGGKWWKTPKIYCVSFSFSGRIRWLWWMFLLVAGVAWTRKRKKFDMWLWNASTQNAFIVLVGIMNVQNIYTYGMKWVQAFPKIITCILFCCLFWGFFSLSMFYYSHHIKIDHLLKFIFGAFCFNWLRMKYKHLNPSSDEWMTENIKKWKWFFLLIFFIFHGNDKLHSLFEDSIVVL